MDALLLIDLQNDFLPGGALPVPEGDHVLPLANALMAKFPLVVASQDWHPANHASFAVNHPDHRVGELIDRGGLPQILWPAHCVQHTPGAAFAPGLDLSRVHHIAQKGQDPAIDSYSAFFDNGRRRSTLLADYLRSKGVKNLWITGLAMDYCVKFSALDALAEGFGVTLIEDASRGVNIRPDDARNAVAEMRTAGAKVTSSGALLGS